MPLFENFTADVLYSLSLHGLPSSPTSAFRTKTSDNRLDKIKDYDLLCFPWTIVEVKQEKAHPFEIKYGCCQAANAASVSLSILEKLIRYDNVQHEGQHIPPVFTFTVVGADVRLWIAYSASKEVGHRDHVCSADPLNNAS
jgi:hypothetical protein